jgi:hypothetical protein
VLLDDLLRNAFHAEDLDVEADTVGKGIVDSGEGLFMHLAHMHTQTCHKSASGQVKRVLHLPPAVLSLRPHRSHLKCFAFW